MKIEIFSLALPAFLGCWVANAADIASKRANEFFDKCWDETVARHPVDESFYGIKTHYDQLEDLSDEKAAANQFHDVVLTNGALPLDVLEDLVNRWIKSKQS